MKATAKGNHVGASRVGTGNFDGVFHRFSAGGKEHALVGVVTADQLSQLASQFYIAWVGRHLETHMGNTFRLGLNRSDDAGVIVAYVEYADPADKIQIALAIRVEDFATASMGNDNRRGIDHTAGNALLPLA